MTDEPEHATTRLDLDVRGPGAWLRPLHHDDVADIVTAMQDPELVRFTRVPAPYDVEDARGFVAACTAEPDRPPSTLAIAVPDDERPAGRLAGVVGLDVDERDYNAELGYWTAARHRGQGLTSAAAAAMCAYGFDELGVARIHLLASVDNPASNGVAAKLGCTRTGTARQAVLERAPDGTTLRRSDATTWDLLPGELAAPGA